MTQVNAVEVISTSTRRPSNGETLIAMVLDETGSMSSCLMPTISSVNEYFASQKNGVGVANASLYTFSEIYGGFRSFSKSMTTSMQEARDTGKNFRPVFENISVNDVQDLTTENFRPNGGTNLYDAIGTTIRTVEAQLTGQDTVPNVLVVIVTDGDENASREYTLEGIKTMVSVKETEGWTFVYLGANQDAWKVGQAFGLSKGQTMSYSTANMGGTMSALSASTASYRATRSAVGSVNDGVVAKNFFDPEA